MELRHVRYFLAVAEERNFTRAAARLGIGQPPLSQQIKDLETELGAPLFHRVPHGAELTEAGKAFLVEARAMMASAARAKTAVQSAHHGEIGALALGFTGSAAFNPVVSGTIRAFRDRWPRVTLSLEEMNSLRLLDRLLNGELDAAFIRPGREKPEGVHLRRLADEAMVVAVPAGHAIASAKRIRLDALAELPFILVPRKMGLSLYDDVLNACRAAGFDPLPGQEAPQMSSVVNLVATGLGVSIVPASIAQIRLEGVAYRPIEGPAPVARLALAYPEGPCPTVVTNLLRELAPV